MNDLPNERWLHDVVIIWRKAPRPNPGEVRRLLEDRIDNFGAVEWRNPYFYIKLIGTPKVLNCALTRLEVDTTGRRAQEIYVLLERNSIFVKTATQDTMTLAVTKVLYEMFYMLQAFEDESYGKPEAATS